MPAPRTWVKNTVASFRAGVEPNVVGDPLPGLRGHYRAHARNLAGAVAAPAAPKVPPPSRLIPGNPITQNEILALWVVLGALKRAWEYPRFLQKFCQNPVNYLNDAVNFVGIAAASPLWLLLQPANLNATVIAMLAPQPAWPAVLAWPPVAAKLPPALPAPNSWETAVGLDLGATTLRALLERMYQNYADVVMEDCK